MRSPQNLKEVQRLAGRFTALSRFLLCLTETVKPILSLLKKAHKFAWAEECEAAFQVLKQRLGTPPILSKPNPHSDLIVYLCVSHEAISAVLIQESETQRPIYFVSRMLQDSETRYQLLEKVALGLVHTARRLRQYFQGHKIVVRIDCPIAKVLRKPELAGRMMAWSIELSEFDISFEPRASNNQAEYEALLAGLQLAREVGVRKLICWTDSKVVSEQVNDNFQVKDAHLLKYYHTFRNMSQHFEEVVVKHCPRENNERADQLARLATSNCKPGQLRTTLHLELSSPSVDITAWGELYRRGFSSPLLKCLDPEQANYVLREIHEGICESHSGSRMLAAKVLRAGYYWPTLKTDCMDYVKKCIQCQKHGNLIHASAEQLHSIIEHPQANGQAEAANKVILSKLKKRLGDAKGVWAEELPEVLWAYRCTPQSTTQETPFRLTYGTKAMIPVEVGEPSFRRTHFDEASNDTSLRVEGDMVDEMRDRAHLVAEACKQRMTRRYNFNLTRRDFKERDLVWRA
uniref:Retrovirus-related Pol polyprotein from transposon 17.6 n=1 Tax=Cajanus cajan TaxID=3821 RepID=A0A151QY53_CAJCA|nr:Retrovirus-related Pol polyprotein from transposon 17.6 [Cajanus cajan]